MKKILGAILVLVVAVTSFAGPGGCAAKKPQPPKTAADSVLNHCAQRRSDLLSQRSRLVAAYGENSLQVADVDRQIALVDKAADERRNQLIEEEYGRQAVVEMKRQAAPAQEVPAPQPAK